MFDVPVVMAVLWRLTGLQETFARKLPGGSSWSSSPLLSVVYAAAVYLTYACACALFACNRFAAAYRPSSGGPPQPQQSAGNATGGGGGKLQIMVIRDTNEALLFVASTTVYWCVAAYRREHGLVHREHAVVADQLFGTAAGRDASGRPPSSRGRRAMDACCWSLYALLAAALSLDVYEYAGTASRTTYAVVHVWGHYVLLTGSVQFAVVVFGLRQCYCQLNGRMRAGAGTDTRRDGLDFDRAAPDGGGGLSVVVGAEPSTERSSAELPDRHVEFIDVLDKVNLLTMLKYWSDLHWSITQIVSKVNNLFRFRLFVFFLCGLLHLMLTPYLLSLTILNENIDVLPYIIERALWFVIHILHVVLMIYPCALLGEEAAKTQILLGSYLNTKIDFFDIKKIEAYAQQLAANKPEFSIYSMFVIDKQLVITLTGAVATYLVIILQLQGQS